MKLRGCMSGQRVTGETWLNEAKGVYVWTASHRGDVIE